MVKNTMVTTRHAGSLQVRRSRLVQQVLVRWSRDLHVPLGKLSYTQRLNAVVSSPVKKDAQILTRMRVTDDMHDSMGTRSHHNVLDTQGDEPVQLVAPFHVLATAK